MTQLQNVISRFELMLLEGFAVPRRDEEGQTLVEYALILVLIAVVVIAVVATLGGTIKSVFSNVASGI
jgi:pilus assembly protein Flp/PilA